MGWNDHDPWFSMIEAAADEYMAEGCGYDEAWARAHDKVTITMLDRPEED